MARRHRAHGPPGWAIAKEALAIVASHTGGDVGFTKYVGSGLSRDAFAAQVGDDVLVALVPRPSAPADVDAAASEEARVLTTMREILASQDAAGNQPAFRVPAYARAVRVGARVVLVTEAVRGVALDMRVGRQGAVVPWQVVATVGAAIHRIDPSLVWPEREIATRRDHALAAARVFEDVARVVTSVPEPIAAARAWVDDHLPPAERSALLHGDLLGQNILLVPGEPPYVIDWERARTGDVAYDLAIVTRGARRPFQTSGGLSRLLEEYQRAGGLPVRPSEVRLFELCMVTGWYLDATTHPREGGESPEVHLAHVERLVAMARASSA